MEGLNAGGVLLGPEWRAGDWVPGALVPVSAPVLAEACVASALNAIAQAARSVLGFIRSLIIVSPLVCVAPSDGVGLLAGCDAASTLRSCFARQLILP